MNSRASKQQNKRQQQKVKKTPIYRLSNRGGGYAPDSMIVDLVYDDATINRSNVGNKFIYWRIRMNSVYDPDPLLLTGNVSGFVEWSALYRRYLVLAFKAEVTMVNEETFPIAINAAPSDIDLTTIIISPTTAVDLGEVPLSIPTKIMSSKGGQDKIKLTSYVDLAKFTGQKRAYKDSLTYSALVNGNPSTLLYWNYGAFTDTNLVNGIFQNAKYTFTVLFTERQSLLA